MKALPISKAKSVVIAHTKFDNKWIWVYNTFMKSKIFIVQRDNDKYFKQKLPTWRNGFCEIVRNVTIEKDPHDIYQDGESLDPALNLRLKFVAKRLTINHFGYIIES
jgi:hypothetical protein